jgi:hypothetical protein
MAAMPYKVRRVWPLFLGFCRSGDDIVSQNTTNYTIIVSTQTESHSQSCGPPLIESGSWQAAHPAARVWDVKGQIIGNPLKEYEIWTTLCSVRLIQGMPSYKKSLRRCNILAYLDLDLLSHER